jgi:hypothetical protein
MFNILNLPTVVFDCSDAQLHLKTRKNLCFFESQLVGFGPEELLVLHSSQVHLQEINTGATFPIFTIVSMHQCANAHCVACHQSWRRCKLQVEKIR